jgi:hypothetical protein
LLVRVAGRQFRRAVMRADDVAESIELGRLRRVAEGKGAERGLQHEQPGRDKRHRDAPCPATDARQNGPSFLHSTAYHDGTSGKIAKKALRQSAFEGL